ncbi:MAG: homoserine dehydrogenase [Bacteroidia bacterium]|jgi:homoserine dehydrogenase|nr:homoserine dehydrogenase [Bacteroidia bacterium]
MNTLNIGLFGFGCVGQGLYEVLKQSQSINANITKICVKQKNKQRSIDASNFVYDKWELLNDENINVIVELIDDAAEAFLIVSEALKRGKAVVTANKKMVAENFNALYHLQQEYKVPLLYEGSVGGAIPIIRTLEEYYDNDLLQSVEGILNGTTNYILTKIAKEQKNYNEALLGAQQLGFAESNPKLDVEAYDPKYKLTILLAHAYGLIVLPNEVLNSGIQFLSKRDTQFATENGYSLKLIAQAYKTANGVAAFVLPQFITSENAFYNVNNEFNAVQVSGAFSDKQLLKGKGAGSYPTAAAVLSDISALNYSYKYGYRKIRQNKLALDTNENLAIYLRYADDAILGILNFETVEDEFVSKEYKYVVGQVSIADLLRANLNERNDVFVGVVERPLFIKKKPYAQLEQMVSIH